MKIITNNVNNATRQHVKQRKLARAHAMMNATPAQIRNYISNNVTSLADVQQYLGDLTILVRYNQNRSDEE